MRNPLRLLLVLAGLVAAIRAAEPAPFLHPGVLNSRAQLEAVREHVQAKAEPWASAFAKMSAHRLASLDYTATPREVVECGPYSKPDLGCNDERRDAGAAYTHALVWVLTKNEAHARKAIELMNAWSAVVKSHTGHNAPLQASWSASLWPRAAELIRHTYSGWAAEDIVRFSAMLRHAYLPIIREGRPNYNGNWELSMIEAMIGCAVFLDDRALFDDAIAMWRKRTPAYFYLKEDGELPVPPPLGKKEAKADLIKYWYEQATFVDGLGQETCRDLGHLQMGLAAMVDTAETALLQGVDLYAEQAKRITTTMEFHAGFLLGDPVPEWLGGGKPLKAVRALPAWEIAYNHYHGRRGLKLPRSEELIRTQVRTRPAGVDIFMAWETLTHAGLGNTGMPDAKR